MVKRSKLDVGEAYVWRLPRALSGSPIGVSGPDR
jgi:hypothetical protein